ncbi:hypothetical protein [Streptomyces sp. ODS28]|uniref:FAS1-like dehydratase domain-containing protein n=1 Tax=Streptomyces sp. ODS28 TaxID=3136688 RepID=UPI0031EF9387
MHPTSDSLSSYVESWNPEPLRDADDLSPAPVAALSAGLDLPEPAAASGDPLPPLWQWLYFLSWPAQSELGPDGHPSGGRFLPPVPDRQRMWAGGRCEIAEPLVLGEPAECVSSLGPVRAKRGRSGEMLFVTVRREFSQRGRTCVVEEQDNVYRSGRSGARHGDLTPEADAVPRSDAPWQLPLRPDPTLLFRFSALTANAHRIHYDDPYVRNEEGYPGLVVHGPLLALLMLELPRRNTPGRRVRSLSYRLRAPLFTGEHLLACGTPSADGETAGLHVAGHRDPRHATAEVAFA